MVLLDHPDRLTASTYLRLSGGLSVSLVLCWTLVVGYYRTGASASASYGREHNDRRYFGSSELSEILC